MYHVHGYDSYAKLPDEIVLREDGYRGAWREDGTPIIDYVYEFAGVRRLEDYGKEDAMAGRNLYFTVDREAFDKALKDRWMTREDVCSMGTVSLSAIEKMLRSGKVSISMAYHICNRLEMDVERVFGKQGNDSDFERLHIFTKPKKK